MTYIIGVKNTINPKFKLSYDIFIKEGKLVSMLILIYGINLFSNKNEID